MIVWLLNINDCMGSEGVLIGQSGVQVSVIDVWR